MINNNYNSYYNNNISIKELIAKLENAYNMQYYDIKKLLKFCLKIDDRDLIIHNNDKIDEKQRNQVILKAEEIKNGTPIQYIINEQDFMGFTFYVNEKVLIPQPDTEIVVQCAIDRIKEMINRNDLVNENYTNREDKKAKIKILDLCTGSGAIGISIKKYFGENVDVTLSDISNSALDVAKINSKKILNNNVNIIQSDMFNNIKNSFDVIVSNPPYIKSKLIDKLDKDVKNEPHIALDGGNDGLKFYRIIKSEINNYLNKNGYLILEIGYDQKEEVQKMFKNSECINDLAGNNRVIIWRR